MLKRMRGSKTSKSPSKGYSGSGYVSAARPPPDAVPTGVDRLSPDMDDLDLDLDSAVDLDAALRMMDGAEQVPEDDTKIRPRLGTINASEVADVRVEGQKVSAKLASAKVAESDSRDQEEASTQETEAGAVPMAASATRSCEAPVAARTAGAEVATSGELAHDVLPAGVEAMTAVDAAAAGSDILRSFMPNSHAARVAPSYMPHHFLLAPAPTPVVDVAEVDAPEVATKVAEAEATAEVAAMTAVDAATAGADTLRSFMPNSHAARVAPSYMPHHFLLAPAPTPVVDVAEVDAPEVATEVAEAEVAAEVAAETATTAEGVTSASVVEGEADEVAAATAVQAAIRGKQSRNALAARAVESPKGGPTEESTPSADVPNGDALPTSTAEANAEVAAAREAAANAEAAADAPRVEAPPDGRSTPTKRAGTGFNLFGTGFSLPCCAYR